MTTPDPTPTPVVAPHPRDLQIEDAAREVLTFMKDWCARHRLTVYEFLYLMNQISGQEMQRACLKEREDQDKAAKERDPGAAG